MPAARTENTTGEHPDACFFYGTLMFPSIISRLLRRPISDPSLAQEAHLPGYVRLHIRERDYPAIVPIDEARTHFSSNKEFLEVLHKEDGVKGVVVTGLSGKEVALLDEWEADEYVKRVVTASVGPKGEEVRLWAYQWAIDEYGELLLPQIWHFDAFVRDKLPKWSSADADFDREIDDMRSEVGIESASQFQQRRAQASA